MSVRIAGKLIDAHRCERVVTSLPRNPVNENERKSHGKMVQLPSFRRALGHVTIANTRTGNVPIALIFTGTAKNLNPSLGN